MNEISFKSKAQTIDDSTEAWNAFWKASEAFEIALEQIQNSSRIKPITNQRIHRIKSKLRADRFDLEFELNRIIEEER